MKPQISKIIFLLVFASLITFLPSIKNSFAYETSSELSKKDHLYWLNLLLDNMKPENTEYKHKEGIVTWLGINNASKYESRTDCSGLFNSVFSQAYGFDKSYYLANFGKERPVAKNYYEEIAKETLFFNIKNIKEVKKGDLIVLKYPTSSNNTGHTMFVMDKPYKISSSAPLIEDTEQYLVAIADSTSTPHGKSDSRHKTKLKGLGKGLFRLYTKNDGSFFGYAWSPDTKANFYNQTQRAFVIGRIKR